MKKIINHTKYIAFIVLTAFALTACFEIKEEVSLTKKGAGNYRFTVDMSSLAEVFGDEISKSLTPATEVLEELKETAGNSEGISDFKEIVDNKNHIYGMTFDFEDTDALNKLVAEIGKQKNKEFDENLNSFSYSDKTFERKGLSIALIEGELGGMDEASKAFFDDIKYTSVYTFKQKIKSQSNKNAVISKNKKSTVNTVMLGEVIKGNASFDNKIDLK